MVSFGSVPGAAARVIVVGAGVGGLVAALVLSCRGMAVTVVERAETPGGKLREIDIDGARIDVGPTVFTMPEVFDSVLAEAGTSLAEHLTLTPAAILARHGWQDGSRLDLHADIDRSADAIGVFAGSAEARGYRAFCEQARRLYEVLDDSFIRAAHPSLLRVVGAAARSGTALGRAPFSTLWSTLGHHFKDPRLRQLFGRYATYCGSSPFACPATLMLVGHVEQSGVWLVEGGMHRLAALLARLAEARGVVFRYGAAVRAIPVRRGRAAGVELATGERIEADAVVCNTDVAALAQGLLGAEVRGAAPAPTAGQRSLSAVTVALAARTSGFPLLRHNVFFSRDSPAEFTALAQRRLPDDPTVYICGQDRGSDPDAPARDGTERLFCIVNAPATGDSHSLEPSEKAECEARILRTLRGCGLTLDTSPNATAMTTPSDFHRDFPGTGGALYGAASHGWMASFRRPGVRSRVSGLYLCGGSTHPGPGLPMAALSGRMAALCLVADWASMRRSRPAATLGGMSTV